MAKARILLVPFLTRVEWQIEPLLSEWADVASYDAPGVGSEPAADPTPEAVAWPPHPQWVSLVGARTGDHVRR